MKKLLSMLVLAVAMLPTFAYADTPSVQSQMGKLSDTKRAELALKIAQAVEEEQAATAPILSKVPAPAQMEKWASVGEQIGKALAGTARELGVVANDFIKTPAGQITMAMIVWKIMGHEIAQLGMGLLMFFTLVPLWIYMFRRMCIIKSVTYNTTTVDGKSVKTKDVQYYNSAKDDIEGTKFFMGLFLVCIVAAAVVVAV